MVGEPLGNDCYKIRIAITGKNKGKSGNARVITFVIFLGQKVYLISVYDKSEQETIIDDELDKILKRNGLI